MTTASHLHGDERGPTVRTSGLANRLLAFTARWLSHACFLSGTTLLLAAGWSS
ncbi:hypothetical protein [Actinoallomurus iriomotensis]|uniref:Uncharacterized protein n=1 Tax=Actinoallomurus iriomotensis TaxID=478107 RepID=A0A9W6W648_9ACTN|nr:hypothetical protein [Actinoallomurus iriomotensis]GLY90666.1 hypothetical protein Airi02_085950 [Actinoallomurus iriomotensis]